MFRTKNIAAMGYSGIYPENTMLAYRKALEAGADGIEVDAHFTRDNVIVLCHDEHIDRTTNGTGKIRDFTYEDLSQYNASHSYMNPETAAVVQLFVSQPRQSEKAEAIGFQSIPKLEELLALAKETGCSIIVEMKGTAALYPGMGEAIAELIMEHGLERQCSISSFSHHYIYELSQQYPDVSFAAVTTVDQLYKPAEYLKQLHAKQIHPYSSAITEDMVQACHREGIEIIAWSVGETDEEAGVQKLIELGVDGIMTHYPPRMQGIGQA
ncbi:glycerophosphodiester phosphodiesterase [Paenibacillus sinopodophylli]|uniref:glycerophosphodiester phosphodiesterase n=1 Tax=Paenibacillus sinopodophylli TaxID=1837342 RepID=UPI00110CC850|nr:glycerophosphodiester phosphodiesterase family protein [Paenibacillus sinopodophylli]